MPTFATRRPWPFAIALGVVFALSQYVWRLLLPGLAELPRALIEKGVACALAIAVLTHLGWWREAGFRRAAPRQWLPFLPLFLLPALVLASEPLRVTAAGPAALFVLIAALTGFSEEAIFRGAVLKAFGGYGWRRAALSSSLVFGALHLANLLAGADPLVTGLQVVFATLFGFAVCAPRLVTGTIWPLIVLHGLQDTAAFLTAGQLHDTKTPPLADVVVVIVLMLPFAAYGYWLMRRR